MPNEITITAKLVASKSYLKVSKGQTINATLSGAAFANTVQGIGTTYEQLTVPTEVATAGYCYLRNLDETNYVEVGVEVSSAFYPLIKLKPGEVAVARLSSTTVFARANTAAVNLEFCLLAD
jgi:hypothetical protein